MDEKYYCIKEGCCGGRVYGRYTLDGLKEHFGYSKEDDIKDINDLERRLVNDYMGYPVPFYIEPLQRIKTQ